MKKFLAMILCCAMLLGVAPAAFAANEDVEGVAANGFIELNGGGKEVRVIADPYESMGVAHGKKVSLKVRNFHAFPMDESAGDFRKILT